MLEGNPFPTSSFTPHSTRRREKRPLSSCGNSKETWSSNTRLKYFLSTGVKEQKD